MRTTPFRIIQISDLHLFADKNQALLGVKPYESFLKITALLKQQPKPDLIVLTGDLSQDDSETSYQYIADILQDFSTPVYFVPGNHDHEKTLNRIFPINNIKNDKHILLDQWQLILLDSQKPGAVGGHIDATQIDFLQQCLHTFNKQSAVIIFHHQPIPVGSAWLDQLGLDNAEEFWNILKKYPNVHTILFGHVHQAHQGEKNGIHYYSPPSTCIQFKKNSAEFALDEAPPGYRWIELYPDGQLKTDICRLEHYVGLFDKNAKGY